MLLDSEGESNVKDATSNSVIDKWAFNHVSFSMLGSTLVSEDILIKKNLSKEVKDLFDFICLNKNEPLTVAHHIEDETTNKCLIL